MNTIIWNNESIWFDISIISFYFLLGHIFLGHFEERSPKWRKLLKYIVTLLLMILMIHFWDRTIAYSILGIASLFVVYVHGIVLPKKGINGWTGEPKGKYYDFRKWDKNIFNE